ncbi:MAG: class I SAM-dependent methyltransferase [Limnochordia bacterium]|nr:class I SAM-dependent methyltransferase [Limnochordia bacterium]
MLQITIKDNNLVFKTDPKLFSPLGLDEGTAAMLSLVEFAEGQRVLDLGCGYGIVGIVAAQTVGEQNVVMVDRDPLAVQLARENSVLNKVAKVSVYESDGFTNIPEVGFDLILSNPPYHADFSVPKAFIEKGFNRLVTGGRMYMVTKRHKWYKNKLIAIFGGVQITEVGGYYVFMAEKRSTQFAKKRGRVE